jgi:hypothetical protein
VIWENRPVNKFMSLAYEKIVDGSNLFLVDFRAPENRFDFLLKALQDPWWMQLLSEDCDFRCARHEVARLNDVMWSTHEISPYYSETMRLAITALKAKTHEQQDRETSPLKIDVPSADSAVSVSPLPLCFPAGKRKGSRKAKKT